MTWVLWGAVGLVLFGPFGALFAAAIARTMDGIPKTRVSRPPALTTVLILLLVELRSGMSVLAALTHVSQSLPDDRVLREVARVASLEGLEHAVHYADERLHPVIAQLSRSQRTGASAADMLRRQLDEVIASGRSRRIERARALPIKLMIPVTLLMLPGMILLLYAPSLMRMFSDMTGVFG